VCLTFACDSYFSASLVIFIYIQKRQVYSKNVLIWSLILLGKKRFCCIDGCAYLYSTFFMQLMSFLFHCHWEIVSAGREIQCKRYDGIDHLISSCSLFHSSLKTMLTIVLHIYKIRLFLWCTFLSQWLKLVDQSSFLWSLIALHCPLFSSTFLLNSSSKQVWVKQNFRRWQFAAQPMLIHFCFFFMISGFLYRCM